jgi:uncharacterized protein YdhG (YjbR/CyaY superfamily)
MNMFKPVNATTSEEYMAQLPADRRAILEQLDSLIQENAPNLKPTFSYNMPGYGAFKYTNYKKEVIDWPTISMASQKNYVSFYVCAVEDNEYIAEKYKDDLGKVSVGKSCIRFKKLEDVNLETLKKVIKLAAENPGFPEAAKKA